MSMKSEGRSAAHGGLEQKGTDGDDRMRGSSHEDHLNGKGGNDTLFGFAGDDFLEGGKGADDLFGGLGNDILDGGKGRDYLRAGQGDDVVDGGEGRDTMLLAGREADWSAVEEGGWTVWTNSATGATVKARNVEKVVFGDHAPEMERGRISASEEGGRVSVDLNGLARDGDDRDYAEGENGLTYQVSGQPKSGRASIEGNALVFDPGSDFQELGAGETRWVAVEVTATDSAGQKVTNKVMVSVTGENDAPELAEGALHATEGGETVSLNLEELGSDRDRNEGGTTLSYELIEGPTEGHAWLDGNELKFDPEDDFQDLAEGETRDVTIKIKASDASGAYVTTEMQVRVTGTNSAPHADDIHMEAVEDGSQVRVDLSHYFDDPDSDDDGTTLKYWVTNDPSEGDAWISKPNTLKFDPREDFQDLAEGETRDVTFKVRAEDSHGARTVSKVTVTVTGVNDRPMAEEGCLEAHEDGGIVKLDLSTIFDDVDSDDDGTTLKYWVEGDPAEGEAWISKGHYLKFNPKDDFQDLAEGEVREVVLKIPATDSHGARVTNHVVVKVTGQNDGPTARPAHMEVCEDGERVKIDLSHYFDDVDSDDDGTTLQYWVEGDPAEGEAWISKGHYLKFDPKDDFQDLAKDETRDITLKVPGKDSHGHRVTNEVTVTVAGKNDAPTLGDGRIWVMEDGRRDVDRPGDNDQDGGGRPGGGDQDGNGRPNGGDQDGNGRPNGGDQEGNGRPNGGGQDGNGRPNGGDQDGNGRPNGGDQDGNGRPNGGDQDGNGRPNDGDQDGRGRMSEDGRGGYIDMKRLAHDVDSDDDAHSLTYEITQGPAKGQATIENGVVHFDPNGEFERLAKGETERVTIEVTVTDRHGAQDTAEVSVIVKGKNDAPALRDTRMMVMEDGPRGFLDMKQFARDIDSDDSPETLRYRITDGPSEGLAAISNGVLRFNPNDDFEDLARGESRTVKLEVTATDRHGASDTAEVAVLVKGKNDAPDLLGARVFGINEDDPGVRINLAARARDVDSDDNGATLNYQITDGPDKGSAEIVNGRLFFRLEDDFQFLKQGERETVSVEVTATDRHGASTTADYTYVVNGRNDRPTAENDVGEVTEDGTTTDTGSLNAMDVDGDRLTYTVLGGSEGEYGSLVVDANGNWTYTLDNDAANVQALGGGDSVVDDFRVRISDGSSSIFRDVDITVNGADDAAPAGKAAAAHLSRNSDVGITTWGNQPAVSSQSESFNLGVAISRMGFDASFTAAQTEAAMTNFLADKEALVIAELESFTFPSAVTDAIMEFVQDGGTLVVTGDRFGRGIDLLNETFGYSLEDDGAGSRFDPSVKLPGTSGTVFGNNSNFLSGNSAVQDGIARSSLDSIGSDVIELYRSNTDRSVVNAATWIEGDGQVTYLAYDFYNFVPVGSQNGGWFEMLRDSLSEPEFLV